MDKAVFHKDDYIKAMTEEGRYETGCILGGLEVEHLFGHSSQCESN